ncbi:NnrS family protein [Acetobacteraceae bacterium]|nr:NnrS family protein [Acetobacteraceae bacterium]
MMTQKDSLPPLLRFGFRPFFLCAGLWAVLSVLIWMLNPFGLSGQQIGGLENLPAYLWHGHEMTFGFLFAVIAGFLLTASSHWSGFNPAKGIFLGILVLLWVLGRLFFYAGSLYPAAFFDVGFDLTLLAAVTRVILKARLWRNLIIVFLLSLPAFLNLDFYLIQTGVLPFDSAVPCEGALAVFFMFTFLIAGRIIPVFAPNALPNLKIKSSPKLDKASLLSGAVSLFLWGISAYQKSAEMGWLCTFVFLITSVIHSKRFSNWNPKESFKNSMIFVLYLSYAWIIISFLLMALESQHLILRTMSVHVMGLGAVSMAVAGMMCRVTRGHTGREIKAEKAEMIFFVMLSLSMILRLISTIPQVMASLTAFLTLLNASATCFIIGFLAFLWRYGPFLCRNRADGKNG